MGRRKVLVETKLPCPETEIPTMEEIERDFGQPVHLLWHDNYWDGALSGVMTYMGRRVYYKVDDDIYVEIPITDPQERSEIRAAIESMGEVCSQEDFIDYDRYRIFNLFHMTEAQAEALQHNHNIWTARGNIHACYGPGNRRNVQHLTEEEIQYYKSAKEVTADMSFLKNAPFAQIRY